jgi:predicted branched-subunit amino acid permease
MTNLLEGSTVCEPKRPLALFPHEISREAFWAGVRETLIVCPSYIPFALVCGVASVNVGLTTSAALALPALVFGGSSQAVLLQFLQSSASLWVAVLSGLVVNLRMAIYSAAFAPRVRHLSLSRRMLAAAFLVDNAFAFTERWDREHPPGSRLAGTMLWYYAGVSVMLWPSWFLFCGIGVLGGSLVPTSWQLDFAIPLSFIAILCLSVRTAPLAAAAVAGGVASLLLANLPLKLGLIVACFVGLFAGLSVERAQINHSQRPKGEQS